MVDALPIQLIVHTKCGLTSWVRSLTSPLHASFFFAMQWRLICATLTAINKKQFASSPYFDFPCVSENFQAFLGNFLSHLKFQAGIENECRFLIQNKTPQTTQRDI